MSDRGDRHNDGKSMSFASQGATLTMRTSYLSDMTWLEAQEAFKETDVALIPLGAIEAHGPHGLLGTDAFAAEEVAKITGRKCNAVVLPVMPYGYVEMTMDFPGTIGMDPNLYRMILENIGRAVHKWGIRRVVWVSGHGPNAAAIDEVSLKLRRDLGMNFAAPRWWRLAVALMPDYHLRLDHGGFTETSVAMAIRPGNVRLSESSGGGIVSEIGPGFNAREYEIVFEGGIIDIPMFMRERWPLGYWDAMKPAAESSEEAGHQILAVVTDYLARFVEAFRGLPLPELSR